MWLGTRWKRWVLLLGLDSDGWQLWGETRYASRRFPTPASRVRSERANFSVLLQDNGPTHVGKLQEHGINASDIKKLQEAGLHTVEAVSGVCAG
jgi:hypothetical protein